MVATPVAFVNGARELLLHCLCLPVAPDRQEVGRANVSNSTNLPSLHMFVTASMSLYRVPFLQALGRAWRIGQRNAVVVYRLVIRGVGEEQKLLCAKAKRRLAHQVFHSASVSGME